MSGIELRGDVLVVGREPNELDRLASDFSSVLRDVGVRHVFVAGYVVILSGRARATQDIDVLVERLDGGAVRRVVSELENAGFWGPAMPLGEAEDILSDGGRLWISRENEMVPHLDVTYPTDEFDRASLERPITAEIASVELPIGPLELQIAYKLYLGSEQDFEDAAHLYTLFGESLSSEKLETWIEKLDVNDEYERLQRT